MQDGSMMQDTVCQRIQWLMGYYLEQIFVDGDNWTALYKNPDDGRYWELSYPQSHMQGGGGHQHCNVLPKTMLLGDIKVSEPKN